ncbi:hypothetical protein NE237_019872 [Protea cynaroides]|uniref:Cytochrome b5 heme-binding domain-containing protein n=1 Tax=Protea cynaroides TaxID=273540 RepID=A0A9Q0H4Z3_9MAGN|nr:hypothetical protein NE237_019872 [Protea cynaroides]
MCKTLMVGVDRDLGTAVVPRVSGGYNDGVEVWHVQAGGGAVNYRDVTGYWSEELRKRNTREDLWISIQGKVYDVTNWVNDHPGGEFPLLNLAGQDVTDAFVAFRPGISTSSCDRRKRGFL